MFKKEELTTRHVVKLRDGRICVIAESWEDSELLIQDKSQINTIFGVEGLNDLTIDLKIFGSLRAYDIMAIKEYETTGMAYSAVMNELDIHWDWESRKLSPEQKELQELEKQQREMADKIAELSKRMNDNNE